MIITNAKIFNSVCHQMEKYCRMKKDDKYEKLYHNVFFMDNNLMCSTNGYFLAVRNMSDCVINNEKFAFPCNIKPKRIISNDGDKLIIENKKDDYFDETKKNANDFNWKKVIPTYKPKVIKEYDFSDYKFKLQPYPSSMTTFKSNGDVIFEYKDYSEVIATYGDVMKTNDDFFDNIDNKLITTVTFPMQQIYWILNESPKFIYHEFERESIIQPSVFITKNYKFIIMPMSNYSTEI